MATWDPVDVSHLDCDEIEDLHADWDDAFMSDPEMRFNRLRGFDRTLNKSTDEDTIEMTEKAEDRFIYRDSVKAFLLHLRNLSWMKVTPQAKSKSLN